MKLTTLLTFFFVIIYITNIAVEFSEAKKSGGDIIVSECINGYVKHKAEHERDVLSWKTCKFQRDQIIGYMQTGFDLDGDGALNFTECQKARNYYFSKAELDFGESCEKVFLRCDCDNDGYITLDDFEKSHLTCLRDCGSAWRVWYFVGSRMPTGKAYEGLQAPDETIDKSVLDQ